MLGSSSPTDATFTTFLPIGRKVPAPARPRTPQQAEELICAANEFWKDPDAARREEDKDRFNGVLAFHGDLVKDVGGFGRLKGAAQNLISLVGKIILPN